MLRRFPMILPRLGGHGNTGLVPWSAFSDVGCTVREWLHGRRCQTSRQSSSAPRCDDTDAAGVERSFARIDPSTNHLRGLSEGDRSRSPPNGRSGSNPIGPPWSISGHTSALRRVVEPVLE